jgi:starvation-inducible DNA-binding protein
MKATLSPIGLNKTKSEELAGMLNTLLANYQMYYQNLRGLHWNIKGAKFFELHLKFEEFYNDALLKIDEIAERILTLEQTPLHSYSDYIKHAAIKETKNVHDAEKSIETIVSNITVLLKLERVILKLSSETEDEGTNSLMSDYIKEQEKLMWMLRAFAA